MRPVDKWSVGTSIQKDGKTICVSPQNSISQVGTSIQKDGKTIVIQSDYNPYRNAKSLLTMNLGNFCSYCEESYHQMRDIQVEHIQPKKYMENGEYIYAGLETKWDNFLLSCATCNGQDNKDTKNVVYGNCHLPHLNNTFLSFCYKDGGVVDVNPELHGKSKENAKNLLLLVGLNKSPKESKPSDTRWKKRTEDWNLASLFLKKYEDSKCDEETIVELARERGGWSIWFTVFKEHRKIRKALIEKFPGTSKECFDKDYKPIFRHPENQEDPV